MSQAWAMQLTLRQYLYGVRKRDLIMFSGNNSVFIVTNIFDTSTTLQNIK